MMAPNPDNPRRLPALHLPPFDPAAHCPKCGHDHVSARYRVYGPRDWICRQCTRCSYLWDEACLSTTPVDGSWADDDDDDDDPDWSIGRG